MFALALLSLALLASTLLLGYAWVSRTPAGPLSTVIADMNTMGDPVLVGAGDIAECGEESTEATARLLDSIQGTVIALGDNAYETGTALEYQDCYGPAWGRHKERTRPVPGNHDYYEGGGPYYAYFGANAGPAAKGYYSYDLGAWHIVALNSNIPASAGSEQEGWLRADLSANKTACTLAYWHHPVFSSGQHGNDSRMQGSWRALYEAKADVVLSAHDHNYERFALQDPDGRADQEHGIREFVVGTGGGDLRGFRTIRPNSEVRDNDAYGVLKLTLHAMDYSWEFISTDGGKVRDSGRAACVP